MWRGGGVQGGSVRVRGCSCTHSTPQSSTGHGPRTRREARYTELTSFKRFLSLSLKPRKKAPIRHLCWALDTRTCEVGQGDSLCGTWRRIKELTWRLARRRVKHDSPPKRSTVTTSALDRKSTAQPVKNVIDASPASHRAAQPPTPTPRYVKTSSQTFFCFLGLKARMAPSATTEPAPMRTKIGKRSAFAGTPYERYPCGGREV